MMGKRRDSRYSGGGGGNWDGGKGKDLSVFDFDAADMQAETTWWKTLAKFGIGRPNKKSASGRQPVDKYHFLEFFSHGTVTQKNHISEKSTVGVNGTKCDSHGTKSPAQIRRNAKPYPTGKEHSNILCIDSDEDEPTVLRSPVSFYLLDNEGSSRKQSSDCGKCSMNIDEAVAVDPIYVKYQNKYYTKCCLTFSQRLISLEGSPLCDPTADYLIELPDFDILKFEFQRYESVRVDVGNLLLKSKCVNAAKPGNPNSDAGFADLEFVVLNDPHWLEKQEEIKSLYIQYQDAWKIITSLNEPFEDIIYPEGDPDAVSISKDDVDLLQPERFINDTLIDFYMKYLLTKIKPEEQHRFHFFNTFFFPKLVDVNQDPRKTRVRGEAFQRVRKWTRNVKLFEKDYIFVPINYSMHWSLIIICHLGEAANSSDNSSNSPKVPWILHMDSISGSHRGIDNFIRSYLWEECQALRKEHNEHIDTRFLKLDFVAPQVPQQENSFDCGPFLLHYAELFLDYASNISTTAACFDFLNKSWFHPAEVSLKKRDQIRNLIYTIAKNKALKCPPSAEGDKYLHSQPHEQQPFPINQFSDVMLPVENESGSQSTSPPQHMVIRNVSEEDDKRVSPSSRPGYERIELSRTHSETCIESPMTHCGLNEEEQYCTPKAEWEKQRNEIILTSSDDDEDVLACVVEDSEEESRVGNIRSRKQSSFLRPCHH